MAAKIADALNITVDYLIGQSDHTVIDKNLMRRMEDIEAQPNEEKDKSIYFIDMTLASNKTKKPLPTKQQKPFKGPCLAVSFNHY